MIETASKMLESLKMHLKNDELLKKLLDMHLGPLETDEKFNNPQEHNDPFELMKRTVELFKYDVVKMQEVDRKQI